MNEVCENENQVVKKKKGSKLGRKIILTFREGEPAEKNLRLK